MNEDGVASFNLVWLAAPNNNGDNTKKQVKKILVTSYYHRVEEEEESDFDFSFIEPSSLSCIFIFPVVVVAVTDDDNNEHLLSLWFNQIEIEEEGNPFFVLYFLVENNNNTKNAFTIRRGFIICFENIVIGLEMHTFGNKQRKKSKYHTKPTFHGKIKNKKISEIKKEIGIMAENNNFNYGKHVLREG